MIEMRRSILMRYIYIPTTFQKAGLIGGGAETFIKYFPKRMKFDGGVIAGEKFS